MEADIAKQFSEKLKTSASINAAKEQIKNVHKRIDESLTVAKLPPTGAMPKRCNVRGAISRVATGLSHSAVGDADVANTLKSSSWSFEKLDGFYVPQVDIKKIPFDEQEQGLIRNFIYAFTGVPSSYIKIDEPAQSTADLSALDIGNAKFKINEDVSSVLRSLGHELLPLIAHYLIVQSLVDEAIMSPDCGQVRQALSAALQDYISNYYQLMAQLEDQLNSNKLSMQKFAYLLKPTITCMELLARIAGHVRTYALNGAELLTYLEAQCLAYMGEEVLHKAVSKLMAVAVVPYMRITQIWTQKGIICDVQKDFCIEDSESEQQTEEGALALPRVNAPYTAQRFRINEQRLPGFLLPHADIILNSGKYLYLLRKCGQRVSFVDTPLVYTHDQREIAKVLQQSYDFSAKLLLKYLLEDCDLKQHLMCAKRFMLMQIGDFVTALFDECDRELDQYVDQLLVGKLNYYFSTALHSSTAKQQPHMERVQCELMTISLADQLAEQHGDLLCEGNDVAAATMPKPEMYAYEAFLLTYNAKWPITLVHTEAAAQKLQMICRALFQLKHVQYHLTKLWQFRCRQTATSCALRQRMLNTIVNIDFYLMIDVIEPNWQQFSRKFDKATNIDDIARAYQHFLDETARMCLLSDSETIARTMLTLGSICLSFCHFVESQAATEDVRPTFEPAVDEFSKEFDELVTNMLQLIREIVLSNPSTRCRNLVKRLEFGNASWIESNVN